MPLLAITPPADAVEAVRGTFQPLVEAAGFRLPALRQATGALALDQPHQVLNLGLSDLVAGRGLDAAKPSGWRYLVTEGGNAVAAAEAVPSEGGGGHVFSAFNQGPFVAATAQALQRAAALPEVAGGSYEARVLHVPALHAMALWLHPQQGGGDLVIPLAPSPVAAPAGQPVAAAEYLRELAAKAASVGAQSQEPTGG